jgi:hypothetical protein
MTFATVQDAALDRALVGDDPETALVLVGAVDEVMRHATGDRARGAAPEHRPDDDLAIGPFTVAMLAIRCVGGVSASPPSRTLDDRAWRPGDDTDPFVVAGAAVAVRERDVAVERAASLAGCTPAAVDDAVDRLHREKE